VGLDGNPTPRSAAVNVLMLGPGERIDAWVEMNQPGVWVMGAPEDMVRDGGLGVVIEYANQRRSPQWMPPPQSGWDYTMFGKAASGPAPTERLEMIFEKVPRGAGKFNLFTVNGTPYPHDREFVLKQGARYRLTPSTAMFLTRSSPAYMGSIADFMASPEMIALWLDDPPSYVRNGGSPGLAASAGP
jgi:FtsP/CotA-like multicopper oxidase with cupredoxin domain